METDIKTDAFKSKGPKAKGKTVFGTKTVAKAVNPKGKTVFGKKLF
jgi:hypothetical protein